MKQLVPFFMVLILASCATRGPYIERSREWDGPQAYVITESTGIDIYFFDFKALEGTSVQFKIEVFDEKKKELVEVYTGIYEFTNPKGEEKAPGLDGKVMFFFIPLDWLGAEYKGKVRISLLPCMEKKPWIVTRDPRSSKRGLLTVVGSGSWVSPNHWVFGPDVLAEKEWNRFHGYYDDDNPMLLLSARLVQSTGKDKTGKE